MRSTPTIHRLLLAAGLLCAAAAPLRAGVPMPSLMPAMTAMPAGDAQTAPATQEASGIEWMEQQGGATLLADNSFSHSYMTPPGFSKSHANDALPARLHLQRVDPDLASSDPYGTPVFRLRTDDEIDPAILALGGLGAVTAAISGILLYARNPISRKRKYRRTPEERRQQSTA